MLHFSSIFALQSYPCNFGEYSSCWVICCKTGGPRLPCISLQTWRTLRSPVSQTRSEGEKISVVVLFSTFAQSNAITNIKKNKVTQSSSWMTAHHGSHLLLSASPDSGVCSGKKTWSKTCTSQTCWPQDNYYENLSLEICNSGAWVGGPCPLLDKTFFSIGDWWIYVDILWRVPLSNYP